MDHLLHPTSICIALFLHEFNEIMPADMSVRLHIKL